MIKKSIKKAKRARNEAENWFASFHPNIIAYHEMNEFVLGDQWTPEESDALKNYKKIPLKFNKLGTMSNGLLGEQQQNTPQLQVVPMENCDDETAELRELIVKNIMFSGNAKTTYQTAAKQSFIGGFGAFAVITDYINDKSFDQDIVYISFKDPTKCYWDASAETESKTDGMHCGWISYMSRKKFKEIYGSNLESKILKQNPEYDFDTEQANSYGQYSYDNMWSTDEYVAIAHHFEKKSYKEKIYKLSNGRFVTQDELDEVIELSQKKQQEQEEAQAKMQMMQSLMAQQMGPSQQQVADPNMPDGQQDPLAQLQQPQQDYQKTQDQEPQEQIPAGRGAIQDVAESQDSSNDVVTLYDGDDVVRIEDEREIQRFKIKYNKYCGDYSLDETIFPGTKCPLIFVDQNSFYNKNGQQVCKSFFADAKDAQRYINYLGTQSAYMLKISRYDQWMASKKNIGSQQTAQMWADPLTVQGVLTYDESSSGAKPERLNPPEISQSLMTQYQRAIEDLYTSTGLYPTRMGQQGNEVSGAAIDARTRQGNNATYTAFNAINKAIQTGGEIVNEIIPHIYDSTRVITLMSPDEGIKNIVLNHQQDEYGEEIENDIRKGSFQVRLLPGPSYEGQKEQALESLNAALKANPQLFNLVADLYAENLPLANTIELKNRFKSLVPPQIIEAGKTGKVPPQNPNQDPQAMQQQMAMQQAAQQNALAQGQLQLQAKGMQIKAQELGLKQQDLKLKAQQQQMDYQKAIQEIELEKQNILGTLEEKKLDYLAETHRTETDQAIAHANNLANILTHDPKLGDLQNVSRIK